MKKFLIATLILSLPSIVRAQDNYDIQDLFSKLKTAKSDTAMLTVYNDISRYYQYTRPDSATYYVKEGLALAKKTGYTAGEALMLNQLGHINEQHDNLDIAKKYELDALALFKKAKHKTGIPGTYNALGVIEGKKGNLAAATQYFLKALKEFQDIKNNNGIVQTYIKLGVVNEMSESLDKALQFYNKAHELTPDEPSDAYFTLMNNIGIVYAKKGDLKRAMQYFEEGISKSDSPPFASVHVSLLGNMGNAWQGLNDNKKALEYHQRSLEKAEQYKLPEPEARALMNMASVVEETDINQCIAYLNKALALATSTLQRPLQVEVYHALSEAYGHKGDYKTAMQYMQSFNHLNDSLFNIKKTREIATLQSAYELEESKANIQNLELLAQRRTLERNLGGIAAVGAIIMFIIVWRSSRKVQVLNKKMEAANQINDKLFSIIGHDLRGPVGSSAQMLRMLEAGEFPASEQKEIIAELRKHNELSFEILNSLLQWGKTQLQGTNVNPKHFYPKATISQNIDVLSRQAHAKGITITDNVSPQLSIYADPDHFDFIIRNIISNAVKFTHFSGKIEISAFNEPASNNVIFSIKDNGTGMSEDKVKTLFDAHANNEVAYGTNGEKGTGLGLMLCKEFVQANKGKIWVESKEYKGTTFFISLRKDEA